MILSYYKKISLVLCMTIVFMSMAYAVPANAASIVNAPTGIEFTDSDEDSNQIAGEVKIMTPEDQSNVTAYTLYWGNDMGKLADQPVIASMAPGQIGGSVVSHTFADNTLIPSGATKLFAYSDSTAGESNIGAELAIPGLLVATPNVKFQVISDMHIQGDKNHIHNKHLEDALRDMITLSPDSDGLMTVGDNTENGLEEQYQELERIFNLYGEQLPDTYFVEGNHDVRWGDWSIRSALFEQYTKMDAKYYDVWIKGYQFIFLGTEKGLKDYSYLSQTQLEWLENKLSESASSDKPVFIFHHQPLKNTVAGANESKNTSFYWYGVRQDKELKSILAKYPQSILFTGHTHWELGSMDTMYNAKYATMFNTAATSYLWTDNDEAKVGSQGYFVEVYDDKILVKGRDFLNNQWIENAQFEVSLPAQIPVVDPAIDPDLGLGNPTIQMVKDTYVPGEIIQVAYTGSVAKDWIGIFPAGTKLTNATVPLKKILTATVEQHDGVLTFDGLNLEPGTYDAVYVGEADYTTDNDNIELGRATFKIEEGGVKQVTGISVAGEGNVTAISVKDGKLQMKATVSPADADNQTVTWSVTNHSSNNMTKSAVIDAKTGLLIAKRNGKVKVTATASDGSGIKGSVIVSIKGQSKNGNNGNAGGNKDSEQK